MDIINKFCHNCGTKLSAASKFCSSCGTSLASIDQKPPTSSPNPVKRVQQNTFEPTIVGAGKRRNDDDDDEGTIRADRVESLAELGINMAEIDISIDVPKAQKESFADVVRAGRGFPQGYREPARAPGALEGSALEILKEGSAIKPGGATHEIKE